MEQFFSFKLLFVTVQQRNECLLLGVFKNFQFILAPDNTTPLSQIFIGEKPCTTVVHAEYHFVSDIAFVIEEEEKILVMSRERIDRDFITQGMTFPGHVIKVGQRAIE